MLKVKFKLGCMVIVYLFGPWYFLDAQTKSFSFGSMPHKQIVHNNQTYEIVSVKDCFYPTEVGKPNLPIMHYTFFVPKGKVVTDVLFTPAQNSEIGLGGKILPVQHRMGTGRYKYDTAFVVPDTTVYNINSYYPLKQAKVFRTDYCDGDLQLVTVEVFPCQYNPVTNKIRFFNDISISLVTGKDTISNKTALKPRNHNKWRIDMAKALVVNPEDLPAPDASTSPILKSSALKSAATTWSVPFYQYVIITTSELQPAFTELIAWKKRKGYNAGIVCIDKILNDAMATGDPVNPSCLNDDAAKLRKYLSDGYNASVIEYALLAGENLPIRYGAGDGGHGVDYTQNPVVATEGTIPTDLYFSEFTNDWCYDGKNHIGVDSSNYKYSYGSQIFVGRIMCNSLQDVQNYSVKLIKYEQNPGNGDYTYLMKSFITQADQMQSGNAIIGGTSDQANALANNMPQFTHTIFSEKPTSSTPDPTNLATFRSYASYATPLFPKGADVISELNKHYGLYTVLNHGGAGDFGSATNGMCQVCNDLTSPGIAYDVLANTSFSAGVTEIKESGNGLNNLTNNNYPFIIYAHSCENMPFDNYKLASGNRNIGTTFTVMYQTGGPAYLGNTRDGEVTRNYNLHNQFSKLVSSSHITNLGALEANSKIGFGDFGIVLTHNLMGDPEMPMWTVSPLTFSPTISENGSTVTITPNPSGSNSKYDIQSINIMSVLDNGSSYDSTKCSYYNYNVPETFYNVVKPYYVTITQNNFIPYLKNPTSMYIQNQTLSNLTSINCQSLSAGYFVDPSQPSNKGNVIIKSGSNVVFNATGNILLDKGFSVQKGASFQAK